MGGPDEEGVEEKRSEIQVQAEAGPTVHAVMTTSCIIWVLRVFIFLYNLESSTQTGGVFCTDMYNLESSTQTGGGYAFF